MRVLLLCNRSLSDFDQSVIEHIRSANQIQLVGALVNSKATPGILNRIKREWKKGRGGYILVQVFNGLIKKLNPKKPMLAEEFLMNIPCKETESLYKTEVYDWINKQSPDCIFLRGFGIIKEPILSLAPKGVLSYHHGDMHAYRGGPPAFWELYNNDSRIGVTLQILDEGLDTGTVVLQKFFPILPGESWSALKSKIYDGSVTLGLDALLFLNQNESGKKPIGPTGKLYTLPSLTQWITLQFKILKRKTLK